MKGTDWVMLLYVTYAIIGTIVLLAAAFAGAFLMDVAIKLINRVKK